MTERVLKGRRKKIIAFLSFVTTEWNTFVKPVTKTPGLSKQC